MTVSENNVGHMFLHILKYQGAVRNSNIVGWMILELANVNTEDGIENYQ